MYTTLCCTRHSFKKCGGSLSQFQKRHNNDSHNIYIPFTDKVRKPDGYLKKLEEIHSFLKKKIVSN